MIAIAVAVAVAVAIALTGDARKVSMGNSLLCRDAPSRVVHQHRVEEIKTYVVERGDNRGNVGPTPLGERRLEVWERGNAGPILLARRAEDAEHC
jgi:hypothetical protein